jgi:nucleoid-associated protein YgaU
MTDHEAPEATHSRRRAAKGRRGTVAPASRVLAFGLSIGAACAIVTALALSQPTEATTSVPLDVVTTDGSGLPTTTAAPPPTTIVVNKIYVPVPAGGSGSSGTSGSTGGSPTGTRRPSGGATGGSGAASSAAQAPAAAPAPAPAPAPAASHAAPTPTTAAPVATTRAS